MRIKRMLIIFGMVGFTGVSSYAIAQSYVYRSSAHGIKASGTINDLVNNNEGETTPEISNLTAPHSLIFGENNNSLSGNVGDTGTVTIYDDIGNQIGQTTSDANGDFSILLGSAISGGDSIEVIVTDGSESLSSTVTVPEVEPSITEPSDIVFDESGEEFSANVADSAMIFIKDSSGNEIGQTSSDAEGQFSVSLAPSVSTGDILEVIITGDSETITTTITVPENIGWLDDLVWRDYGEANGFSISYHDKTDLGRSHWHSLSWGYSGLSNLPTEPYPLRVIDRTIQLGNNEINQIDGFRYVTKADGLNLENNNLVNLNGLSSLAEAGGLRLYGNQINDISGLSSLKLIDSGSLELNKNNLRNVDGLISLESAFRISLNSNDLLNVNGLSALTSTNGVHLHQNPNLTDISGLRNISGVQYEGLSFTLQLDSNIAARVGFVGIPDTSWICQAGSVVELRGPSLSEICI